MVIRGHEFHYSEIVEQEPESRSSSSPMTFAGAKDEDLRPEGYQVGSVLASYVHLHWGSAPEAAERFVLQCAEWAGRGGNRFEMSSAKSIMFLGTGSDVGKSVLAAAFCRIFRNVGFRVAPFKAQNMALNSFITPQGGEMGRAQVVQAEAAGIEPSRGHESHTFKTHFANGLTGHRTRAGDRKFLRQRAITNTKKNSSP